MNKPYIICHMMMSIDGRIDCAMTEKLKGVDDYYDTLSKLNAPSTLSGKTTAALEMALPGIFKPSNTKIYGKESFSKKIDSLNGFEIVVDTKGTLLWNQVTANEKPYLIITSEKVTLEYLKYLDSLNISWIVTGKNKIDLKNAMAILYDKFHVERLAVVGGATINTAFLKEHLLDEISLLIGAGIDGRKEYISLFDGLEDNYPLTSLSLIDVKRLKSDAIYVRYKVGN